MFHLSAVAGSLACLFGLTSLVPSAVAQVVNVDARRPTSRAVPARSLEPAVRLQLLGHPDTARREIDVRAREGRVELNGTVASESERATAERLAGLVAADQPVVNRLRVRPERRARPAGVPVSRIDSPAELQRRYREQLGREFSADVLNQVTLTVYAVSLEPLAADDQRTPAGEQQTTHLVAVLEGTVPSADHQLAMSDRLLVAGPPASAVLNRTYLASTSRGRSGDGVRVRVPLIVDVDTRGDGADVNVFPWLGLVRVRSGGKQVPADDQKLADQYIRTIREDAEVGASDVRCFVVANVITIEGKLPAAGRMRAVALARKLKSVRGVVDRTETIEGGPPYHNLDDLSEYLSYRLGEHADAWEVEIGPAPNGQLRLRATVPTTFHALVAATAIGQDPALAALPLDLQFAEWSPAREATDSPVVPAAEERLPPPTPTSRR